MYRKISKKVLPFIVTGALLGTSLTAEEIPLIHQNQKTETKMQSYSPPIIKNETVYVNLDYYGGIQKINVVNGYRFTEGEKLVDYGKYKEVRNMSNYLKPQITEEAVIWPIEDGSKEFYYQGTLDEAQLPWHVEMRYKLNGVEVPAESLAGAYGMIETIITIKPNPKAEAYYQNNFMLQLTSSFDLSKCLSVEAKDAAEVTLGDTKTITFMAMPGETQTFRILVGTESYESQGINIVMLPAKMTLLRELKEIREKKEKVEDAAYAISDSLDVILDSSQRMTTGVRALRDGTKQIQEGFGQIREDDPQTDANVNKLIEELENFNTFMQKVTPHLQTAQKFVADVYSEVNTISFTIEKFKVEIDELTICAKKVKKDVIRIKEMAEDIQKAKENLGDKLSSLSKELEVLQGDLRELASSLYRAESNIKSIQSGANRINAFPVPTDETVYALIGEFTRFIKEVTASTDQVLGNSAKVLYSGSDVTEELKALIDTGKKVNTAVTSP